MKVTTLERPAPARTPVETRRDAVFQQLLDEAARAREAAPELTILLLRLLDRTETFEEVVVRRLAQLLSTDELPGELLLRNFDRILAADPEIGKAMQADALAVVERDPAVDGRLLTPVLFFKGFHALQTYRLAHHLWRGGRQDLARYLHGRAAETFDTDLHPAARIGRRVLIDHATGVVIGETAIVEDDVSILQGVTLGGSGISGADRHPTVRHGVLLGAGATVLGPVEIGANARVAAGSLVTMDVAPGITVAGVPARQVGRASEQIPAHAMDHMLGPEAYEAFTYVI